jgi:hypothetical protein
LLSPVFWVLTRFVPGVTVGSYPAFYLLQPVRVLKGTFKAKDGRLFLERSWLLCEAMVSISSPPQVYTILADTHAKTALSGVRLEGLVPGTDEP